MRPSILLSLFADVWHIFRADRARFALTLSGVVIGVGSLIFLSGLLDGAKEALINASQQATEDNLVRVRKADVPEKQQKRTTRPLAERDRDALADAALLEGAPVEAEEQLQVELNYRKAHGFVSVVGTVPEARELYGLELDRGRFLVRSDIEHGARVAVVGNRVYTDILGAPAALDDVRITAQGEQFQVVGVLKHRGSLGGDESSRMVDRRILVPRTAFAAAYRSDRHVERLYVRLAFTPGLGERVKQVRDIVRGVLLRGHYGVKNFAIIGENAEDAKGDMIVDIIRMLMLTTAALSLVVGGINIMNIMLVSVTERTREIGVRRALGATKGTVLAQFLAESALVAMLGGVIGLVGGILITRLATLGLSAWLGAWRFHLAPWAIWVGVGSAGMVGILFGIYPAWRAARLNPCDALRFE
jgi:putative ABC transport system permease protein